MIFIIYLFSLNFLSNILLKFSIILYFSYYSYGKVIFFFGLIFGTLLFYLYNKKNRLDIFYSNLNLFNKYLVYLFLFIIILYFIDYCLYPITDLFLNTIYLDGNDSNSPKEFTIKDVRLDTYTPKINNPVLPLEDELYLSKLIDLLQNSFNLYICIFLLINLCIIFLVFKSLSDLNYNLEWLSKYKYGSKIKTIIIKIISSWRKSNLLFFYLGMFMIWLFSAINLVFIQFVLQGLQSL